MSVTIPSALLLRFAGLSQEKVFCKYHRFLSRARWNALKASRILLHPLIHAFCKQTSTLVFAIDETIERRRGKSIAAKGIYHDAVRSSRSHFVKYSGLRRMCLTLCTPIAWAQRCWALPFLTALAPSERACEKEDKHHKEITDWARQMVLVVCRWLKGFDKRIVIVAHRSYSALELLQARTGKVAFFTRLRLDAALYDPIKDPEKKNPGSPRLKGIRQPTLKQRLEDSSTPWRQLTIPQWYDKQNKVMWVATGTSVWYHVGLQPVALRWVLLRDPEQKGAPAALLSTYIWMSEQEIIGCFIRRWSEEVTLREVRRHLGVETNRQWSPPAIAITTPCLMALFSFVARRADRRVNKGVALVVEQASWYKKELPTFADALTAVRIAIYGAKAMHGMLIVTTKGAEETPQPQIELQEKRTDADYLNIIGKAPLHQQYQAYLQLRDKNLLNPVFYYDVASHFLKHNKPLSLQILTNLSELDYQNHELHKLFAFKLKKLGEAALQQYVLKKVLLWRPQEPQSYRDYALALAEKGHCQAALDTLFLALTKEYNEDVMLNYEGIEEIIVTEINHLAHRFSGQVNTAALPKKLLHPMPVDIRVVLNWNMNDTDIDLWVTDSKGEKCFYSHRETTIGGRMSQDFTEGYGPEQFLLKKAPKGKYTIQVHYYGENGVKVAGKTTFLVEVFTHYGRSNEQRKLITLQLEEEEKEGIYVGSFEF